LEVNDQQLVAFLLRRDGPFGSTRPHRVRGYCRFPHLYPEGGCPWCDAEKVRVIRERADE
jgi:hypothetical protein